MKSRPLRLIAIGCGRVYQRYHHPAIVATSPVRLVGTADPDPACRAWACRASPGVPCADSPEDILDAVDADAALIATPPPTHAALSERSLRAGLAVLVEKPMATELDDAIRVVERTQETGQVLRVGFNRRYRADYAALRERVGADAARVGFTLIAERHRWSPNGPITPAFVVHDAGSHGLDLIAHVTGRRVERVRANAGRGGAAGLVRIEAELAGGVRAVCTVGHGRSYYEDLTVATAGGRTHRIESPRGLRRAVYALYKLTARPSPSAASYRAQLGGFAAACAGASDAVGADGGDGFASVAAVHAALRSIDRGDWQDVPAAPTRIGGPQ